ncbi:MAG: HIT family protein [Nakamurella sp.]
MNGGPTAADGCFTCSFNGLPDRPIREEILQTGLWRLAHAFGTSVAGWLVLVPLRHITSIGELTAAEGAELGGLLADASRAVEPVTGCQKTYVAMFAEKDGFGHVHFHLIPRAADLSPELRGPRVFALLNSPPDQRLTDTDADRISTSIRAELCRIRR